MEQQMHMSPAQVSLSEVMGMTNHKVTALEVELWQRLIDTYGDAAIQRFLAEHVLMSDFAPRPSNAQKMLAPGDTDSQIAFAQLVRAVKNVGHMSTPTELNSHPVLMAAVQHMGGWASVCNAMPATDRRYEFEGFQKQFDAAFRLASSRVKIHGEMPKPLVGIIAASRQLALGHASGSPALEHDTEANDMEVLDADIHPTNRGERA
jgi:hypothetical protein